MRDAETSLDHRRRRLDGRPDLRDLVGRAVARLLAVAQVAQQREARAAHLVRVRVRVRGRLRVHEALAAHLDVEGGGRVMG